MKILSIQSDILGHKTYCALMRHAIRDLPEMEVDSHWYNESKSLPDRIARKFSEIRLPFFSNNRDFARARGEWATAGMSHTLLMRKLHEKNYDALHFHTQVQAFRSLDVMKKTPSVITIDMTAYQVARESTAGPLWTYKPNISMEREVFSAASHIVTFSEWARQSVITDHGITPGKVSAIPPGVLFDKIREPNFGRKARPRILFIGNDIQRKGGFDLLDVFQQHFAGMAELHMVTKGSVTASHPLVFIHRGVSAYSDEWHGLLQAADILVLASYDEAFGLVLQEGAAYGLALLGSRVAAIPEMITDGINGHLIRPGDKVGMANALHHMLTDPDALATMRRNSRARALRDFDAEKNFKKLSNVLAVVAAQGPQ